MRVTAFIIALYLVLDFSVPFVPGAFVVDPDDSVSRRPPTLLFSPPWTWVGAPIP